MNVNRYIGNNLYIFQTESNAQLQAAWEKATSLDCIPTIAGNENR